MAKDKKKAFTLTELLVVVVVIGILAAVALPKYSRIMETRKTTEAEEMMAAVRTEQEHRCALDKPYVADFGKLSQTSLTSLSSTKAQSEHFVYELSGTGMLASSKGKYTYNLEMPSYTDGRVCCSGDDCDKLNKDYMNCNTLKGQSDYRVENDCAAQDVDSTPVHKPCDGQPKPDSKTKDCNQEEGADWCGLVTTSYECVGDTWVPSNSGVCKKRKEDETMDCPCGPTPTAKYECSKETYEWELGEFSPKACEEPKSTQPCQKGTGTESREYWCDENTKEWAYGDWDTSGCKEDDEKAEKGTCLYHVQELAKKTGSNLVLNYKEATGDESVDTHEFWEYWCGSGDSSRIADFDAAKTKVKDPVWEHICCKTSHWKIQSGPFLLRSGQSSTDPSPISVFEIRLIQGLNNTGGGCTSGTDCGVDDDGCWAPNDFKGFNEAWSITTTLEDFEATHMLRSRESTVYTDLQLCARCENHPGEKQCLPTSFISQGTWQVLQAERQVAMLVKAPANCPTLGGMSGEKSQQSGKGCEAWSIGAETACTWEAAQATGAWVRRGITVPAFGDKTGDYCGVVAQGKAVCERKDGGGSGEPITDQYEAVTMLPLWTRSIKYCYNPLPQED